MFPVNETFKIHYARADQPLVDRLNIGLFLLNLPQRP